MLHELQVHRQILYELAATYLGPMSGPYERLFYLAGLRNRTSRIYAHDPLSRIYGEHPVSEALAKAHEEAFEGILELPLAQQERELHVFLESRAAAGESNLGLSKEALNDWIPPDSPAYLGDLFHSNVAALFEMLPSHPPGTCSDK
jgi:hypothetical protein